MFAVLNYLTSLFGNALKSVEVCFEVGLNEGGDSKLKIIITYGGIAGYRKVEMVKEFS